MLHLVAMQFAYRTFEMHTHEKYNFLSTEKWNMLLILNTFAFIYLSIKLTSYCHKFGALENPWWIIFRDQQRKADHKLWIRKNVHVIYPKTKAFYFSWYLQLFGRRFVSKFSHNALKS